MSIHLPRWVLLLALCAVPASAHVGDLFGGMDVMLPLSGDEQGVDASFGLLWSEDGDRYDWICHEAILAPEAFTSPTYNRSADGVFLGIVPTEDVAREAGKPVYRSTDRCDWQPVEGLDDQRISSMAFAPLDASIAVATTGHLDARNVLFRSIDGGASFQETEVVAEDGWIFRSVDLSATGAAWATSMQVDPNAGRIHHAPDGVTWTAVDVPLEPVYERVTQLDLLVVSPTNANEAWFVRGPIGGPDHVLHTTDGGQTLISVLKSDFDIVDGALDDDGALWIVRLDTSLLRGPMGTNFEPVVGAPTAVGVDAGGGAIHVVTRDSLRDGELAVSVDGGQTWASRAVLDAIDGPIDCPDTSHVGAVCPELWDDTLARLVGDTDEPGDTDDPVPGPGCACSSGSSAGWFVGLLPLFFLRRRR